MGTGVVIANWEDSFVIFRIIVEISGRAATVIVTELFEGFHSPCCHEQHKLQSVHHVFLGNEVAVFPFSLEVKEPPKSELVGMTRAVFHGGVNALRAVGETEYIVSSLIISRVQSVTFHSWYLKQYVKWLQDVHTTDNHKFD